MRVMLDVGAHYGETLDVALDPATSEVSFPPEAPRS